MKDNRLHIILNMENSSSEFFQTLHSLRVSHDESAIGRIETCARGGGQVFRQAQDDARDLSSFKAITKHIKSSLFHKIRGLFVLVFVILSVNQASTQTFYNRAILKDIKPEIQKKKKTTANNKDVKYESIKVALPSKYTDKEKNTTSNATVKCYLDDAIPAAINADFSYQISFKIQWTTTNDTTTEEITMPLKYGEQYFENGQFLYYHNVTSIKLTPIVLIDSLTSDTLPFSVLPGNAVAEVEMTNKSFVPCQINGPSAYQLQALYYSPLRRINITWQTQTCADYYELEWVYVDDYTSSPVSFKPPGNLSYFFPHKAMRVRVNHNFYNLPGVFRHGWVIFRVRAVQTDQSGNVIPSIWSLGDNYDTDKRRGISSVSSVPNNAKVQFGNTQEHEPKKNYYFEMFNDETGQRHFNISYYDGQLISRQALDFFDTDSVHILQQSLYDPLWRPVIQLLPAPQYQKKDMTYTNLWSQQGQGQEYQVGPWVNNSSGDICSNTIIPPPMASSQGASRYYSTANPFIPLWQTTSDMGLYTPNAEGYPFTTTLFTNEPDNRVRQAGGPGPYTQPGSGHASLAFYGVPTQSEIDRLLGNNAGISTYYRKTVKQDPNGTVTEDIYNLSDQLVISSHINPGANLLPLDSAITTLNEPLINIQDGVFAHGENLTSDDTYSNTLILQGENSISYDITFPVFQDTCKPDCYDCVYQWKMFIRNACGQNILEDTACTIGLNNSSGIDSLCGNATGNINFSLNDTLSLNEYTFYRHLMLDSSYAQTYFDLWLHNNPCILTPADFMEPDSNLCNLDCDDLTDDPVAEIACEGGQPSFCSTFEEFMLLDVSPTGQYAACSLDVYGPLSGNVYLSLFNPNNILQKRHFIGPAVTYGQSLYRLPQYYDGVSWHDYYINDEGIRDTLFFTPDSNFVKNTLQDTVKLWLTPDSLFIYTFPQFLKMDYFVEHFRSSWAKSLLVYHPEFWYYYYCINEIENVRMNVDGQSMNTFEFDVFLREQSDSLGNLSNYVCDIVNRDPFFSSNVANSNMPQGWVGRFEWKCSADTASCYNYPSPRDYFTDRIQNYANGMSLWETAFLSSQCDASYPLPSSCSGFNDTLAAGYFFNIYIAKKQELFMRYLHIRANQRRGYNGNIGPNPVMPGSIWLPNVCDATSWQSCVNYPLYNLYQLCNIMHWQFYKYKQKRWGFASDALAFSNSAATQYNSTLESLGYPSPPPDLTQLNSIYNAQVTQYQHTGLCPAAADLSELIRFLSLQGKLIETVDLAACSYPGLALFALTGSQNPVWTPQVNGNTLNVILSPDNRVISFTIDTPAFMSWNYPDLLSLQNLVISDTSGGTTHFSLSLWYRAPDSTIQRTIVQGQTTLPIQDCYFAPACEYASFTEELFSTIGQLAINQPLLNISDTIALTPEISALLDEQTATVTCSGSPSILSIAVQGHNIRLQFDRVLPSGNLAFYGYHVVNIDTAGCINTLLFQFVNGSGQLDSIQVTIFADNQPLPVYCCSQPESQPCAAGTTSNTEALLELFNNIIQENYTVPYPLTQYLNNEIILSDPQSTNGDLDFNLISGPREDYPDTCHFHLEGAPGCISQYLASATELIPLPTYNDANGYTYHFLLVVTATSHCSGTAQTVTDTLEGYTSCFPLQACPCDESPCINFDFPPIEFPTDSFSPCEDAQYANSIINASNLYAQYIDSLREAFFDGYFAACSKVDEKLNLRYPVYGNYHTLYEYDDNGNLLRTIPPGGVTPLDSGLITQAAAFRNGSQPNPVYPLHTLVSNYRYNSQNQIIQQHNPDAGLTCLYYDKALRNVLSQNAKQRQSNRYSYIKYDALSRPIESGTGTRNQSPNSFLLNDSIYMSGWLVNLKEILKTQYDVRYQPIASNLFQKHLRSRVSAVFRDDDGNNSHEHAQFYSYDAAGNVRDLLQDIPLFSPYGNNRYKIMTYEYDIITGKVTSFSYQKNKPDQWLTKYTYNADNKILEVFTSRNGIIWERDARYEYYLHQPLKRTVIGQSEVQGLDYVYTIEGRIKAVNGLRMNPTNDFGGDGGNGVNAFVAKDALAYGLYYHPNDYKSVANLQMPFTYTNFVPLYNGNIAATMICQDSLTPLMRSYRYDGLNRLRGENVSKNQNHSFVPLQDWKSSYSYDLMGNITTLNRNAGQQSAMDRFQYQYYPNTNRLSYIQDSVPLANFHHDVDNQTQYNYTYDPTGNLIQDTQSEIYVFWNDYGKIKDIRYCTGPSNVSPNLLPLKLNFTYDAGANRLSKTFYVLNNEASHEKYTDVYVRDPQGNPIATYKISRDSLYLDELCIYGTERIGVYNAKQFLAKKPSFIVQHFDLTNTTKALNPISHPQQILIEYKKRYELTDWLGNVRVVITNKHVQTSLNPVRFKPQVVSVSDYYPFGMQIEERSYESMGYRWGYNGQIMDNEVAEKGSHLTFEYRTYDSRIGKFLSVDPLALSYPWNSTYAFAENRPIDGIDLEGLEYRNSTQNEINNYNQNGNGNLQEGNVGYIYRTGEESYQTWVGEDQWQLNNGYITNTKPLGPLSSEKITFNNKAYNGIGSDLLMTPNYEMDLGMTILNTNGTTTTINTNDYGLVRFPESGPSFDRYNPNNENYMINGQHYDADNYATPTFGVALYNSFCVFNASYPNYTFYYGDISAYNPSINLGHSNNGDHSRGTGVDIRYMGENGAQLTGIKAYSSGSIELFNTFINIAQNNEIINNYSYGNRYTHEGDNNNSIHKNHFHIGFGQ